MSYDYPDPREDFKNRSLGFLLMGILYKGSIRDTVRV